VTRRERGLTVTGALIKSSMPLYRLLYEDVFMEAFLDYMRFSRINPVKLSLHMFKISLILCIVPVEIMDFIMEYVGVTVPERLLEIVCVVPMNKMIQYV
jgi:hypothetical protein